MNVKASLLLCLLSLFSVEADFPNTLRRHVQEQQEKLTIRNGTDAPVGRYPFFVGLHVRAFGLICGGTLVHPNVVLTAAHCRNFGYGNLPLVMFAVDVGGKLHSVRSVKMHPSYDPHHRENGGDLMLLYFDNPKPEESNIVQLNSHHDLPHVNETVSLSGYGLTGDSWSARPSRLQQVTDLRIKSCKDAPESWFHEAPLLCTVPGPSGANVCNFDSGSPLLLETPSTNGLVQVGIVSLGEPDDAPKGEPPCVTVFAGYTPIAEYHDWIQANLPPQPKLLRVTVE